MVATTAARVPRAIDAASATASAIMLGLARLLAAVLSVTLHTTMRGAVRSELEKMSRCPPQLIVSIERQRSLGGAVFQILPAPMVGSGGATSVRKCLKMWWMHCRCSRD